MSAGLLSVERRGEVAVVTLDDGKANAISPAMIAAVHDALDRVAAEAKALVLTGRPGRFSGGFDLGVMGSGPEPARALVTAGAELALRLYGFPLPVVVACTGHALAMGAFLVLAGDLRLGAAGAFKLGLNEVAIGIVVPSFGVELARARLSPRHLTRAVALATLYDPEAALDAGFLDRVVPADALRDEALGEAERLAKLTGAAVAGTKRRLREATIEHIRATLEDDMARIFAPPSA